MNIAIIASPYLPIPPVKYGGTERYLYYLIKGLSERGHHVILFGTGDSKVDCEIVPIVEKSIPWVKDPKKDKILEETVRAEAKETTYKLLRKNLNRIDIIHSHGVNIDEFKNIPHLFTLHGSMQFSNSPHSSFHQYNRALFYNTISHNQSLTTKHLRTVGTIYHGYDPEEFPLIRKADNYLSYLGRYSDEKNPDQAMHLAIETKERLRVAAKLDFSGVNYFKERCKPLIEKFPQYIKDLGEQDDKGKIEMISHAKANLHPAAGFREPFGLTILEAAYCGTPTLAVRKGSLPELIEDGKTGVLVEDFVEGMFRLHECYSMNREYIAERARRLFNYSTMSALYEMAYENIIGMYRGGIVSDDSKLQSALLNSRMSLDEEWRRLTGTTNHQ